VNVREAKALIELAEREKLFIMEALWTRFLPITKTLKDIIASGEIGRPTSVTANLGFALTADRLRDPDLAGGAMLDLGVYPINFAWLTLGQEIEGYATAATKIESGVDEHFSLILQYKDGAIAHLSANISAPLTCAGTVHGKKGYLLTAPINNPEFIEVYDEEGALRRRIERPPQINGYEYELEAAVKAIAEGKLEHELMPWMDTLNIMALMDEARLFWGVRLPNDKRWVSID